MQPAPGPKFGRKGASCGSETKQKSKEARVSRVVLMGLFSGIAKAVAGPLVGGIVGNKLQSSSSAKMSRTDWERQKYAARNFAGMQMEDIFKTADESGIHRLAALGAPGAAQYSPVQQNTPDFGFIGDAIGDGVRAYDAALEKEEQRANEKKIVDAEANARNAEAEYYRSRSRSELAAIRESSRSPDAAARKDIEDRLNNNLTDMAGLKITPERGRSSYAVDVEAAERRYADVGAILAGIWNLGADIARQTGLGFHDMAKWITTGKRPPGLKDLNADQRKAAEAVKRKVEKRTGEQRRKARHGS